MFTVCITVEHLRHFVTGYRPLTLTVFNTVSVLIIPVCHRPDMTFAVDWALSNNYLSILSVRINRIRTHDLYRKFNRHASTIRMKGTMKHQARVQFCREKKKIREIKTVMFSIHS